MDTNLYVRQRVPNLAVRLPLSRYRSVRMPVHRLEVQGAPSRNFALRSSGVKQWQPRWPLNLAPFFGALSSFGYCCPSVSCFLRWPELQSLPERTQLVLKGPAKCAFQSRCSPSKKNMVVSFFMSFMSLVDLDINHLAIVVLFEGLPTNQAVFAQAVRLARNRTPPNFLRLKSGAPRQPRQSHQGLQPATSPFFYGGSLIFSLVIDESPFRFTER